MAQLLDAPAISDPLGRKRGYQHRLEIYQLLLAKPNKEEAFKDYVAGLG